MADINVEQVKRAVFYAHEDPATLAQVIVDVNASPGEGFGNLSELKTTNKTSAIAAINEVVDSVSTVRTVVAGVSTVASGKAMVALFDGAADGATVAVDIPSEIIAVFAVVKASGAVATKFLLDVTTDYTLDETKKVLTCVTDQSANKLIVIYK